MTAMASSVVAGAAYRIGRAAIAAAERG
jgi:hypothetical protein